MNNSNNPNNPNNNPNNKPRTTRSGVYQHIPHSSENQSSQPSFLNHARLVQQDIASTCVTPLSLSLSCSVGVCLCVCVYVEGTVFAHLFRSDPKYTPHYLHLNQILASYTVSVYMYVV